jgi:hypothetical protein
MLKKRGLTIRKGLQYEKKSVPRKHTVRAQMQVLELTKAGSSIEFEIFAKKREDRHNYCRARFANMARRKETAQQRFSWSKFAELMDEHSYR